ncbi:MAG: hypothetical protein U9N34_08695 [Candidatus Cloacimonadota bacterium]|nr:hypothetical protein [Candidatus Cloacimonadota bacterium]
MSNINFTKIIRNKNYLFVLLQNELLEKHKSVLKILSWRTTFSKIVFFCDKHSTKFYSKYFEYDNVSFEGSFVNINPKPDETIILVLQDKTFDRYIPANSMVVGFSKFANFFFKSEPLYSSDLIIEFGKLLGINNEKSENLDLTDKYAVELKDQVIIDIPKFWNYFKMKSVVKHFTLNFSPEMVFTKRSMKPKAELVSKIINSNNLDQVSTYALEAKFIVSSDANLLIFLSNVGIKNLKFLGAKKPNSKIELFKSLK